MGAGDRERSPDEPDHSHPTGLTPLWSVHIAVVCVGECVSACVGGIRLK
jgi:hypothetical protein